MYRYIAKVVPLFNLTIMSVDLLLVSKQQIRSKIIEILIISSGGLI